MTAASWERGSWMQTFTGRRFYPLDPHPSEIDPVDIAHALSLICRYGGHTRRFYSVAEHCVILSHAVAPEHALWALLHDASEAYVGDMVRPLKHHMPTYQAVEDRVIAAIAARFRLSLTNGLARIPSAVKDADNRILLDERAALLTPTEDSWGVDHLTPLSVHIHAWSPEMAEYAYAERLAELTSGAR
jgi:hypothetical protein